MSNPVTFPHDARSAAKAAKAGVVTVNDLICEDTYGIMTRDTASESVSHTAAVYSLDEDTSSLVESTRNTHTLNVDGSAEISISLLNTAGATRSMQEVYSASPAVTSISTADDAGSASASFTKDGLKWDNETSSLYIGGNIFRLQYSAGDTESGGIPCLRIQARHPTLGGYVTKFSIIND